MSERFYKASFALALAAAALHTVGYGIPLATEPFFFALGIMILWHVVVLCILALGMVAVLPTTDSPWERRARYALIVMLGATALGVSYTSPGISDPAEDGIWLAASALLVAAGAGSVGIHSRFVAAILGMAIYTMPLGLLSALYVGTTSPVVHVAILLGLQALVIHVVLAWKRDRKEIER
jgi:hypothetical protein